MIDLTQVLFQGTEQQANEPYKNNDEGNAADDVEP